MLEMENLCLICNKYKLEDNGTDHLHANFGPVCDIGIYIPKFCNTSTNKKRLLQSSDLKVDVATNTGKFTSSDEISEFPPKHIENLKSRKKMNLRIQNLNPINIRGQLSKQKIFNINLKDNTAKCRRYPKNVGLFNYIYNYENNYQENTRYIIPNKKKVKNSQLLKKRKMKYPEPEIIINGAGANNLLVIEKHKDPDNDNEINFTSKNRENFHKKDDKKQNLKLICPTSFKPERFSNKFVQIQGQNFEHQQKELGVQNLEQFFKHLLSELTNAMESNPIKSTNYSQSSLSNVRSFLFNQNELEIMKNQQIHICRRDNNVEIKNRNNIFLKNGNFGSRIPENQMRSTLNQNEERIIVDKKETNFKLKPSKMENFINNEKKEISNRRLEKSYRQEILEVKPFEKQCRQEMHHPIVQKYENKSSIVEYQQFGKTNSNPNGRTDSKMNDEQVQLGDENQLEDYQYEDDWEEDDADEDQEDEEEEKLNVLKKDENDYENSSYSLSLSEVIKELSVIEEETKSMLQTDSEMQKNNNTNLPKLKNEDRKNKISEEESSQDELKSISIKQSTKNMEISTVDENEVKGCCNEQIQNNKKQDESNFDIEKKFKINLDFVIDSKVTNSDAELKIPIVLNTSNIAEFDSNFESWYKNVISSPTHTLKIEENKKINIGAEKVANLMQKTEGKKFSTEYSSVKFDDNKQDVSKNTGIPSVKNFGQRSTILEKSADVQKLSSLSFDDSTPPSKLTSNTSSSESAHSHLIFLNKSPFSNIEDLLSEGEVLLSKINADFGISNSATEEFSDPVSVSEGELPSLYLSG